MNENGFEPEGYVCKESTVAGEVCEEKVTLKSVLGFDLDFDYVRNFSNAFHGKILSENRDFTRDDVFVLDTCERVLSFNAPEGSEKFDFTKLSEKELAFIRQTFDLRRCMDFMTPCEEVPVPVSFDDLHTGLFDLIKIFGGEVVCSDFSRRFEYSDNSVAVESGNLMFVFEIDGVKHSMNLQKYVN